MLTSLELTAARISRRSRALLLLLAASMAVPSLAVADPPRGAQMGVPDYGARQRAMHRLWSDPQAAAEAVQNAAAGDDPEARERARWIMDQWRLGISPDTPPPLRDLLRAVDNGSLSDLESLLREGQIELILPALRLQDRELPEQISGIVRLSLPKTALNLLREERVEVLDELLDLSASDPELVVRRALYLRDSGRSVEECLQLPIATEDWQPEEKRRCQACLAYLFGREGEAMELARPEKPGVSEIDDRLYIRLLIQTQDWETLSEFAAAAAEQHTEPSAAQVALWGLSMVAARRGDLADPYDRALQQIRAAASSEDEQLLIAACQSFVLDGRLEEVLERIPDTLPVSASELLRSQYRYPEAIQKLGLRPDHFAADLDQLIDLAMRSDVDAGLPTQQAPVERALQGARIALHLDHLQLARDAYERISGIAVSARRMRLAVLKKLLDPYEMVSPEQREWAAEIAARRLGHETEGQVYAQYLAGNDVSGGVLLEALQRTHPGDSMTQRARQIIALSANGPLRGGVARARLPDGWNRTTDLDQLALELHQVLGERSHSRASGNPHTSLANTFIELGRDDLAEPFLRAAAEESLDFPEQLVEFLIRQRRWAEATQLLENSWHQRFEPPVEALPLLVQCYRNSGRLAEALELEAALERLPLSAAQRHDLAATYEMLDQSRAAVELLEVARRQSVVEMLNEELRSVRQWIDFTSVNINRQLGQLYEAAGQPGRAADCFETMRYNFIDLIAVRGYSLEDSIELSTRYLYYSRLAYRFRGLDAAERGDAETARRELTGVFRFFRADIDLAERTGPTLRELGMEDLADTLVDHIFGLLLQHAENFPFDPAAPNNAAWVAAINGRNLEKALELSKWAVFLRPASTAYRDTLAEVLFRLDRREEALAIEHGCLIDAPAEWHLHQQIDRFSK